MENNNKSGATIATIFVSLIAFAIFFAGYFVANIQTNELRETVHAKEIEIEKIKSELREQVSWGINLCRTVDCGVDVE